MEYNTMAQTLTNAFATVIVGTVIIAVGYGILGFIAWCCIWVGKWVAIMIKKQYVDAVTTVWNGKKAKA